MSEVQYIVDVPGYPPSHSPYSHAVVANGFVFVSGQAPVRPGGGKTIKAAALSAVYPMKGSKLLGAFAEGDGVVQEFYVFKLP